MVLLSDTDQRQDQLRLTLRKTEMNVSICASLEKSIILRRKSCLILLERLCALSTCAYILIFPLFCMYLKLSSEAGNSVFPLMPQCLFHSPSHPRVLAA